MGIEGKYQFLKEENYISHFKALLGGNIPADVGKAKLGYDDTLEISINGDNITLKNEGKTNSYVLNKPVEEKIHEGMTVQIVAKLDGDSLTLETVGGKMVNKSVYALSGSELVVTLTAVGRPDVPEGKKFYKKL